MLVGAPPAMQGQRLGCFSCLTCLFVLKPNACHPGPNQGTASDLVRGPAVGGVLRLSACRASLDSRRQARRLAAADAGGLGCRQLQSGRKTHTTRCAWAWANHRVLGFSTVRHEGHGSR
jgi:hypothetical protein